MRAAHLAATIAMLSATTAATATTVAGQIPAGVTSRYFDNARTTLPTREPWTPLARSLPSRDTSAGRPAPTQSGIAPRIRPLAPLVSAIAPGAGQALLGNNRGIAYAAVEVLAWLQYAKQTREQRDDEAAFKSIARRVARAHFTTGSPDALSDGSWAYYEQMRDDKESGQYSLSATGEVVPENDPTTYNGKRWLLALSTNPTRAEALEQYKREAVRPEFEWSWSNAQLQYDIFTRTTFQRDDAHNAATHALLVIGANHVLSMIDAFTTIRLRARARADGGTALGASVPW